MKNYWRKGVYSFDNIRSSSFEFANEAFEFVKILEKENKEFEAIELMNHAPKILRILDSIEHESDIRKFRSGIQNAKSEIQSSILALLHIYRDSDLKSEIDVLVKKGQSLQQVLTELLDR
ncbi:MAG: hypothetical protein ACOVP1_01850 [Bacteroidia bacterium]